MLEKESFIPIPFINREKEKQYIMDYLTQNPASILFLYGPKSTGKTTLIDKIINELDNTKYAINYLDMREVLIKNFSDFQRVFFPTDLKGKVKEIVSGIKMNIGFFGWDIDDEKLLYDNIFELMKQKLIKANEKGIKPVIILDEFQYLKNIIIDKENNLLLVEELFKFFIALTKVRHLAHVICLTSDSYYIEELYNHAKLKNTSRYFLIDHISKKDVYYWLGEKEGLNSEIVEYFWENLGGSVWEIWQCFIDYKNTGDYKKGVENLIENEYAKIFDYLERENLNKKELEKFKFISTNIAKNGEFVLKGGEKLLELIKKLVDIDVWFYDATKQKITANSQTTRKAFEQLLIVNNKL